MLLEEALFLQRGDAGTGVALQLHGLGGRAPRFIRGAHTAAGGAEVEGLGGEAAAAGGEDLVWAGEGFWRLEAQTLLLRGARTEDQGELVLL